MVDATPFLPGLSLVQGKAVVARFDGGRLSSEGGLLALREIERRLGLPDRLAGCLRDPRMPEKVVHRLAEIIRFRMLMIAAGYEDGNDANTLRADPMFKLALDRLPSGEELCSQSTVSRLENLPDRRALLRLGRALGEQYCSSFRAVPKRIVLDIDDTFDRVHGGQQLRLFNAYYDDYGFQPIFVFYGERGEDSQFCAPPRRRHPRPLAQGRDPAARRQSLRGSGSVRLVSGEPGRLAFRPGPQCGSPPPCHGAGEEHVPTLQGACPGEGRGGAEPRQGAPFHAVLRCRGELEPGGAHHRAG